MRTPASSGSNETRVGAAKLTAGGSSVSALCASASAAASRRASRSASSSACTSPRWRLGSSMSRLRGKAPYQRIDSGRLSRRISPCRVLPTRLASTPANGRSGWKLFRPWAMAPKVCAMAEPSMTASTGTPKRRARSAAEGAPSNRPITPSIRIRSASPAASQSRRRDSSSPTIHRSS